MNTIGLSSSINQVAKQQNYSYKSQKLKTDCLSCFPYPADQSRTQKVGEMTSGEREGNMVLLTERECGEEKRETETTTF